MKTNKCKFCLRKIVEIECKYCGSLTPKRSVINEDINKYFTDYSYNRYDTNLLHKIYSYWLKLNVWLFISNSLASIFANTILRPITGGKPAGLSFRNKENLFDIGCGKGNFMRFLPSRWEAEGCDIVKYKNVPVNIITGNFEKMKLKKSYSIVRSSHSVEHSLYPAKFIKRMISATKKGGTIIILTPNADSIAYKLFRERWTPLNVQSHYCILSMDTVGKFLQENGCKVLYSSSYSLFSIPGSLLELLNIHRFKNVFFIIFIFITWPVMLLELFANRFDSFVIYAKKL